MTNSSRAKDKVFFPQVPDLEIYTDASLSGWGILILVPDSGDWKLDPGVFNRIQEIWPSSVDAFAAPWNAQLPSFISWHPQPGAFASAYCPPPLRVNI